MRKSKYFVFVFFIIWGLLFGGIPLTIFFSADINEKGSMWFLLIFIVLGICSVVYGIFNLIKVLQDKRILKTGKTTVGTFVTREGYGSHNGVQMYKIVFNYKDEQGNIVQASTNELYTFEEVETFAQSKSFEVKYAKNRAVIVPNGKIVLHNEKNVCEYCGTEYSGDKCTSCGAKKLNKK